MRKFFTLLSELPDASAAGHNYMLMLYALAHASISSIHTILEVGAGPHGTSALAFAYVLDEIGGEHPQLVSIEISPEHPIPSALDYVREVIGVDWRIVRGDSLKVPFDQLPTVVDLLYIDGDHGGEHALGDYRRFSPLVRKGGLIVFDDYPIATGVVGAVDVLAAEHVVGVVLTYNHQDGNSHWVTRKGV